MATPRPANSRDMKLRRSLSSDDQVSTYASLAPFSREGGLVAVNYGAKPARKYSNSNDSGIHMDEGAVPPARSPYMEQEEEAESLQDELFSALIPTHQEKRGFFAKGRLSKILTEERVRDELTRHLGGSLKATAIEKHAKTICEGAESRNHSSSRGEQSSTKSFIKILAILIIIGKTQSIVKLLEENVNDSDLPFIKTARPNDEKLFDLRVRRRQNLVLRCFKSWNQLNIHNFEEWQWATLPVDFVRPTEDGEVQHLKLEEQQILPFIRGSWDSKPQSPRKPELEGGFASVFQVAIHPDHHNFHSFHGRPDPGFFAVKRLHSQNEEAFKREVEILNKFSGNKHGHLISLLATYEQCDRFFLVFDWAEADLQRYWTTINPTPEFDLKTVTWMVSQCKGIANGIIKIHSHESIYTKNDAIPGENKNVVFGHHGDIKPENVLWFADSSQADRNMGGTLKLSDFGLAEFSIHQTTSMPRKSKWGVSLGYRAPESDLQRDKAIGRSYDIWTLGCLYLEFITWMLGGSQLLEEFLEARKARDAMWHDIQTHTFFKLEIDSKTNKPTAVIKPEVKQVSVTLRVPSI